MKKSLIVKIVPKSVKSRIRNYIIKNTSTTEKSVNYNINIINKNRMQGKCIIVTGGTGAIGSAICYRLVCEGATVGLCGRKNVKIINTVNKINEMNLPEKGHIIPLVLDVNSDDNIEQAINDFVGKTGRLDAFINNAGGGPREKSKEIHQQNIEVIDSVLNTNLRGSIICARKAAQIMVENGFGKIINISSVIGMCGKATMSDYAAAKAGIIGFTKSLAIELGKYNVKVNSISPGMVNQQPFDRGNAVIETNKNCLRRFGFTDEVANLVAFLISDEAEYITGQNFVIDGGRCLGLYGDSD